MVPLSLTSLLGPSHCTFRSVFDLCLPYRMRAVSSGRLCFLLRSSRREDGVCPPQARQERAGQVAAQGTSEVWEGFKSLHFVGWAMAWVNGEATEILGWRG